MGREKLANFCSQNVRMFDIADTPFSQVPEDEKKSFVADIKGTGSYQGYKLRQYWVSSSSQMGTKALIDCMQHIDAGVRDQIEHYNRAPPC